jgi:hypothetical protein
MKLLDAVIPVLCISLLAAPLAALAVSVSASWQQSLERLAAANRGAELMHSFSEACAAHLTTAELAARFGTTVQEHACREPGDRVWSVRIGTGMAFMTYYAGAEQ